MRWVCEAVWSGYRSSQSHVCHRHIIRHKKTAELFSKITTVLFTDGTTMSVSVRQLKPREKVMEKNGYTSLLSDFAYRGMEGFCSVESLREKRQAQAAQLTEAR